MKMTADAGWYEDVEYDKNGKPKQSPKEKKMNFDEFIASNVNGLTK